VRHLQHLGGFLAERSGIEDPRNTIDGARIVRIEPDGGFVSFLGIEDAAFTKAKVAEHALQAGLGFVLGERVLRGLIRFVKAFGGEQGFGEQDAGGNGGWVFGQLLLQDSDCGIRVARAKLLARGIHLVDIVAGCGSRDGGQEQAD
jgi:hypothetical protein